MLRRWTAGLLTAALVWALAGCSRATQAPLPPAPGASVRLQGASIVALTALQAMADAARGGNWTEVRVHQRTYRAAWAQIGPQLPAGSQRQQLEQVTAELAAELDRPGPNQAKIAAATDTLTRLLQQASPAPAPTQTVAAPHSTKTFTLTLLDYRFDPPTITVTAGTHVVLEIKNATTHQHELELAAFEIEAEEITPGGTAHVEFMADRPGSFQFACHLPGHFESGMKGTVVVKPAG